MADELIPSAPEKSLLIAFDLEPETPENLQVAYKALAEVGFLRVAQNVILPTKTVIGTWFGDNKVEWIRGALVSYLHHRGLPISRIIVAEFLSCAWIGTPVP